MILLPPSSTLFPYTTLFRSFDWNLLAQRAFGLQPIQRTFDQLFALGIDPVDGGLPSDTPADWPERAEVERYKRRIREELERSEEHTSELQSPLHILSRLHLH